MSWPILNKFFFIYLVFYEYAYIGAYLFGGKMTYASFYQELADTAPGLYYLMNFNDFGSGIVVLFQ